MRKICLLFFILGLLVTSSFTPNREITNTNIISKVEKLYVIGKVWGFLKYYHPKIGTGAYDWDEKLLGVLKFTSNIETYDQLNTYLSRWIYAMGPRKPCASCKKRNQNEYFLKNFDLSWTRNNTFSDELRKTFSDIENNRFQGEHHYIGIGKAGQFEPKNEEPYVDLYWKDEHQRLLPLFRYWNYVEYFHPHKYLTNEEWDDVLKEMIPKFLSINSKLAFHQAMLELVVKADDSHAGLVTPILDEWPYYNYLPAKFEMVENQAVFTEIIDTEKARAQDLKIGDVMTSINGQSVKALHDSHTQYIWGSNDAVKERSIYYTLFMGLNETSEVTIRRDNSVRNTTLNLYHYSEISYDKASSKEKWRSLHDSIGYVDMGALAIAEVDGMMHEFKDKAVIILDLRNQPRGTYKAIAKHLKPNSSTFAVFTKPDFSYPGKFIWKGEVACGEENEDYFKGKVILLIDENTQNHAEFTCMCLLTAPNVVTIGSQTAGTNGSQSKFPIYSQYYTSFTGTGVYYPDGKETQRVGILPDIYAAPTINGIREGSDEVLEKAMDVAAEELTRLQEMATLGEMARLDSLKLRLNSLAMDSLIIDSLKMDDEGDY